MVGHTMVLCHSSLPSCESIQHICNALETNVWNKRGSIGGDTPAKGNFMQSTSTDIYLFADQEINISPTCQGDAADNK